MSGYPFNTITANNRAVFDWCLRNARHELSRGQIEKATHWCSLGAFLASANGWFGKLADPGLEDVLCQIATKIPESPSETRQPHHRRWLHVMTEAWHWGGMVENVRKWIRFTAGQTVNSIVVHDQSDERWIETLRAEVQANGGTVVVIARHLPILEKAAILRQIATQQADVVVLHTVASDIVPSVAFGVPGGPPILRMNHDDHMFWVGGAIADLVLNFRELGERWTRANRGVDRSFLLPLPLHEPSAELLDQDGVFRRNARARLGIPTDSVVLLAVGSGYKFVPFEEWNFLDAADAILARCPNAFILGAGMEHQGPWLALSNAHEGRLKAVGIQKDMSDCLAAADIGLGSIPFPSQTAILEIGIVGRPCVQTPLSVPMSINDVAFDDFYHPQTLANYVDYAVTLTNDSAHRLREGSRLRDSVRRHHGPAGWLGYFERLMPLLPEQHLIYALPAPTPLSDNESRYWASRMNCDATSLMHHVHNRIIKCQNGILPLFDQDLADALHLSKWNSLMVELKFLLRRLKSQFSANLL
jgi:hypothetical protein